MQRPNLNSNRLLRVFACAAFCVAILSGLSGCSMTEPYKRTLPQWIMRVSVPMADNQTAEPGLEELVTAAVGEELLADGRVDLAPKRNANAVLKVTLLDYKEAATYFSEDDVAIQSEITLTLRVDLYEPSDLEMETPIGTSEETEITQIYSTDYRSTRSTLEVDARSELAEKAARRVVQKLISGIKMNEEM